MKFLISVVVLLQVCSQQLLADPIPELHRCKSQPCKEGNLHITVDNILELFFDGEQVSSDKLPHAQNWTYADTVKVPASVQVIGVKGVDYGVVAGILASGAHSITDHSWRCTSVSYDSWNLPSYDDSHWPKATVIGPHNTPGDHWGTIAGISLDAKWIWTPNHQYGPSSDKTVYCRKKRTCTHDTGGPCITSCHGRADGDYQSCKGCTVYATCSNGLLYDQRPCASAGPGKFLYWDDNKKRCEWESDTCKYTPATVAPSTPLAPTDSVAPSTPLAPTDSGGPCITSCRGRADGDYQSCKGCTVYATCSNGLLYDQRPCAPAGDGKFLYWDDNKKRCEWESDTCK